MNRWKIAFFVQMAFFLSALLFLLYHNVDQAVTLHDGREGRADVEAHRDMLNALLIGRVTKHEIRDAKVSVMHDTGDYSYEITAKDFYFNFDGQGRYKASQLGASTTMGFIPKN